MEKIEGDLLKDKKEKGELLKDVKEGKLLKDVKEEGDPLWKDKKRVDEDGDKDRTLNE
jgi:hypothetical protein